ncbi:LLM class flavin-dependent oxidoreductase [Streptomyces sp. NPDC088747]|uniref:LLM class flavin-dependent oxidoreductase n=1 Tax=Streptomyces sp. NPDC088747 TaxID=3365886 RepID=UPI0037F2F35E
MTEPVRFAYWVPNVSGGLVTSKIEQRTDWGYEYNRELAVLATERLKVIAAVHPGLWHPGVLAKFTALGEPWLEHDERYRRSEEFIRALRQVWTEDHTELAGDFYWLRDFTLKPKPTEQLADVHRSAAEAGRRAPKFGLNGFLIARDTEAEARDTLREIVAKADSEAVEGFGAAVKQAGQATSDGKGMWQDSSFEDLVQYNDGFRTGLIGTPEQIAERIVAYKRLGVDLLLLGFLHYHEEVEYFGRRVLPLVRELEAQLPDSEAESVAVHA